MICSIICRFDMKKNYGGCEMKLIVDLKKKKIWYVELFVDSTEKKIMGVARKN